MCARGARYSRHGCHAGARSRAGGVEQPASRWRRRCRSMSGNGTARDRPAVVTLERRRRRKCPGRKSSRNRGKAPVHCAAATLRDKRNRRTGAGRTARQAFRQIGIHRSRQGHAWMPGIRIRHKGTVGPRRSRLLRRRTRPTPWWLHRHGTNPLRQRSPLHGRSPKHGTARPGTCHCRTTSGKPRQPRSVPGKLLDRSSTSPSSPTSCSPCIIRPECLGSNLGL
jgi:hypothetical protein